MWITRRIRPDGTITVGGVAFEPETERELTEKMIGQRVWLTRHPYQEFWCLWGTDNEKRISDRMDEEGVERYGDTDPRRLFTIEDEDGDSWNPWYYWYPVAA